MAGIDRVIKDGIGFDFNRLPEYMIERSLDAILIAGHKKTGL
ncbi:hypothetical protein [Methylobacter sp. BlB1]|nr:hypothetical protein [Methylobacter sp. BlB1]